jgi:hypothetical protein
MNGEDCVARAENLEIVPRGATCSTGSCYFHEILGDPLEQSMKTISGLLALAMTVASGWALAQNVTPPGGASNPPPGTTHNSTGTPLLPESTTNTAKPGAVDANASGAQAAARSKFEEAGFSNVKALSRSVDGVWTGRGVMNGVEVGIAMDPAGRITQY